MSQGQFAEAHQVFNDAYAASILQCDIVRQSEAAGWLAWSHGELEQFNHARRWCETSVHLLESHFQMSCDALIDSVSSSQALNTGSRKAAHVLSRTLRIHAKVLAVRIVHHLEFSWLPEAKELFGRSIRLDDRLQLAELGHALRWRAVVLSAEDYSQVRELERLLSAAREHLPVGSPGAASLVREQGIIRWQKNRLAKASTFLWDAKERLTSFADARALGPTFCVLSKIILQDSGDIGQARRYALIAATLHPYGYVLDHCIERLRALSSSECLRAFDDIFAGRKPFDVVHGVMSHVADGSPHTATDLIGRNINRLRAALSTWPAPLATRNAVLY